MRKNSIKLILATAILCFTITACNDKDNNSDADAKEAGWKKTDDASTSNAADTTANSTTGTESTTH
jgi:hypothetical protein